MDQKDVIHAALWGIIIVKNICQCKVCAKFHVWVKVQYIFVNILGTCDKVGTSFRYRLYQLILVKGTFYTAWYRLQVLVEQVQVTCTSEAC